MPDFRLAWKKGYISRHKAPYFCKAITATFLVTEEFISMQAGTVNIYKVIDSTSGTGGMT